MKQSSTLRGAALVAVLVWVAGCSANERGPQLPMPAGATNHPWFPIGVGATHEMGKASVDGPLACEGCHRPTAESFAAVRCDQCHRHTVAITQRLHLGLPASFNVDTSAVSDPDLKAELRGANCYGCHPTGAKRAFSHTQITDNCTQCHAETNAFAALPKAGFTHRDVAGADCSNCHVTTSWSETSGGPLNQSDPTRNVIIDALQPSWVGTTIVSVTADQQSLRMPMNHAATSVDAGVLAVCTNCHAQAEQGQYYPGVMHWSLTNLGLPQPATCAECHRGAPPSGFVGDLDARRSPSTGEMRHDAVEWLNDAPTTTRVLPADCSTCHQPPLDLTDTQWTFADGRHDAGAEFHASLTAANLPQPRACLDCHANSRPVAPVAAANFTFDHATAPGECKTCHASTSAWSGGKFHAASAATPSTCLPCHDAERPTSTTGWLGAYQASPFDYATNVNGEKHGAGLDCAECHRGPGTGLWGTNQNWQGGHFTHAPTGLAGTTCITCHTTQRPDLLTPPATVTFNHALSGTGDCVGCHQATVTRNVFTSLTPIPGGDWRGGQSYPTTLISTPAQTVRLQSTLLNRSGATVTGMTTTTVSLPNAFLHTSSAIAPQLAPGVAGDPATCWHCHTSTGTNVTAYANGRFHASLSGYRATPDAGVTVLVQPTACLDCHRGMRPPNIVSKTDAGTWLMPMDHAATFVGGTVSGVPAMDCGSCHHTPGLGPTQWSDGKFHPSVPGGATPSDCVSCHYPLSTTTQADLTITGVFTMKHRSTLVTTQACATCHATALGKSSTLPTTTTLWKTGAYHSTLTATTQPAQCLECHAPAKPAAATQGTVVYALVKGGTATNGAQWMNHDDATVTGKDCATCHLADAKVAGSAWNKASAFHAKVPTVTGCAVCHGLTNGRGTVVGTNNNLPAGLVDSVTVTTSIDAPANTHDQISHADSNVTRFDCKFCHTQVGPSAAGKEWAKATFHRNFTSATPLVFNATGRCSNCHVNVKPGATYARQDHAAFTATSAQDCASCHSWPGTSATTPNWLGATGAHASSGSTVTSTLDCNTCHGLGGNSTKHLTVAAASHYAGITNGNKCTSCHIEFSGFKGTVANLKYAHTNATANVNGCVTCHAFTASLYTTLTTTPPLTLPTATGGHQFSQATSVTGNFSGDSFTANHTNTKLTRCGACHQYATTASTTNIWTFKHRPSNPGISNSKSTSGCNNCH